MKRAAVIGSPVSHSLSPEIFSFIARQSGFDRFNYTRNEIKAELLPDFFSKLREGSEWLGVNVTIPHKKSVLELVDALSEEARAIGAANVVARLNDGSLTAHNTDVKGILDTLHDQDFKIQDRRVLVIGAGGAARALAYAVGRKGAKSVSFLNPTTPEKALELSQEFARIFTKTEWTAPESRERVAVDLVAQCTPIGMHGIHGETTDFYSFLDELTFSEGALAFDLIYRPENTAFLNLARRKGLRAVGGLDMLISQALATWEIWRGELPEKTGVKNTLKETLKVHLIQVMALERPIFLTGFMGVGKTVTGSALARRLGWEFIDTDQVIEQETSQSISDIFSQKGEPFFRGLESKTVLSFIHAPRTVVALGGGTLLNSQLLKRILSHATLIYLEARPETIKDRLAKNPAARPLLRDLQNDPLHEKMISLFRARFPGYAQAHAKIEDDALSVEQVVDQIVVKLAGKLSGKLIENLGGPHA